jgi:hypothetical protein
VQALRNVAASLSLLGHLADGEVRAAVLLVSHLVRIAAAVHGGSPAAARLAAAAVHISPQRPKDGGEAGPALAVREALPDDVARVVLSDPAWSVLAVELASSGRAADRLRTAYLSRELQSAESSAAILHYRLVAADAASAVAATPTPVSTVSHPRKQAGVRHRTR